MHDVELTKHWGRWKALRKAGALGVPCAHVFRTREGTHTCAPVGLPCAMLPRNVYHRERWEAYYDLDATLARLVRHEQMCRGVPLKVPK